MGRYVSQGDAATGDLVPSLLSYLLLSQLTRDDTAATSIDTDVLDRYVAAAEAEIDSFLGVRYALPLASVPQLVADLAARGARYRAYTARAGEIDTWLKEEREADLATLERIAKGLQELGLTLAGEDPAAGATSKRRVRATSAEPKFGRSNLGGY